MAKDVSIIRAQDGPDRVGRPAGAEASAPPSTVTPTATGDPVPLSVSMTASNSPTTTLPDSMTNPPSNPAMMVVPTTTTTGGAGNGPPKRPAVSPGPPDPFDPEQLRLSQDFAAELGVKKALLTVPVDKPKAEWWFRVRAEETYRLQTLILNMKEDRERYLISPVLRPELATEPMVSPQAIFTGVNRQGVVFLWPVRLPGADGKIDQWSKSAMEAAMLAMTGWVRMAANMHLGAYDVWETFAPLPEPQWPNMPFKELLKIGFKDRYIDTMEHPVLKRLRGES